MATAAKTTTDHDKIRKWVEARGGHPARVAQSGTGNDPGILRIDYPGFSGEDTLEAIEWDEFFEWFDRNNLAFLHQASPRSRFSKFVERSSAKRSASKKRSSSTKKASTKKAASSSKKTSTKKASSSKKTSAKKATSSKKTASKKASRHR